MGSHSAMLDDDGDSPDWIELFNGTGKEINLKGFGLSDKPENPARWVFPERKMEAGEYLVVFASGKDMAGASGEFHTNFKLSEKDEKVCLSDNTGTLIDCIKIDKLPKDVSYGRHPATGKPAYFPSPTPGKANTTPALSPVVKYSVQGGYYRSPISVKLYTDDEHAVIYYTTDGSTPTVASPVYAGPLKIDRNTVIRAVSLQKGFLVGPPSGQAYLTDFDSKGMAVVSIAAEPEKLWDPRHGLFRDVAYNDYMLRDMVRAHVSYFDENGHPGFSQDAMIGVVGASSRQIMMRPLKICATERADPLNRFFRYRLLPGKNIDRYRHFELRNNNQDGIRYVSDPDCTPTMGIRNALFSELVRGREGIEIRDDHGPVLLFINGKNYGMMNIGEKRDNTAIAENNPSVKAGDVDLLVFRDDMGMRIGRDNLKKGAPFIREDAKILYKGYFEDGAVEYEEMSESARKSGGTKGVDDFIALDPTDPGTFDPASYIATMAAHAIACNADFGMNNLAFWRSVPAVGDPGPFHAYSFDFDSIFGLDSTRGADYDILPIYRESTKLFSDFLKKEEYKTAFIRKVDELLNGPFRPEYALPVIEKFKKKMEPWITYHLDMWAGGNMDTARWNKNVDYLKHFIKTRPTYMRLDLQRFFDFKGYSDMTFSVAPEDGGSIVIDTGFFRAPLQGNGTYANIPMTICARASDGYRFSHFNINGAEIKGRSYTLTPENGTNVQAVFVDDSLSPASDIVINEVVRSGKNRLEDEDGQLQDWIEIYNTTKGSMDLAGACLTDDDDDLAKWRFPAVSIGPGGFLVVFASGKNRTGPAGRLHTNFKLSAEPLLLVDKDGKTIIDEVTLQEMESIPMDCSGIKYPDGSAVFMPSATATPGQANVQGRRR